MTTIGIGITTRNRPGQADEIVKRIRALTPDAVIAVVDDASDQRVGLPEGADISKRFDQNVGIARAKNACLERLDHCDHIFLFDDDAYPLCEDWWRPYIESSEPHLMRIFPDLAGRRKLNDITKLYENDEHVAWSGPRGMMLYIDARKVLPVVGGMDPVYGLWGYEHGDWSNRIHHAGLTSWRYADVVGGEHLIHSMDEHEEIDRSVAVGDRRVLASQNVRIHNTRRDEGYQAYVEYREAPPAELTGDRDIVITHLYSSKPDPQRPGEQYPPTGEPARTLVESIPSRADVVIINDAQITFSDNVELVHSELAVNVFFQRHLDSWRYLRDHPEVRYVWCVDATDVTMLREPWDSMRPGVLYTGYEPTIVENAWLRRHHQTRAIQAHIKNHGRDRLLNAGVIGGDRTTVMAFLHDMVRYYFDTELHRFLGHERGRPDLGDMGAMQLIGHRHRDHLETGPQVVTTFKAYADNGEAWFQHK